MKRFFCLILILLLGGCASYYRTVNELACSMDTWGRVGKEIFFSVDEINPEVARFRKVAVETGGSMFIGQFSVHVDLGSTVVRWIMPEQRPTTMGYHLT